MNALRLYRISRWFYLKKFPFLPSLFRFLNVWFFACKVPSYMPIGKNTKFAAGGLNLNINAKSIGENCVIGTGCVFMRKFPYKELPVIRHNVYISHGVKVIGPIIIENNSIISANCVVTKSVPKNAIVAGVPGKIIGYTTDLEYDIFNNTSFKNGWMPYLKSNLKN